MQDRPQSGANRALFSQHAKTFSLAALFFRRTEYEDVASLYAFCRVVDDLVDNADDSGRARARLERLREELRGGALKMFPELNHLFQRRRLSSYYLLRMIDAVEQDLAPRQIQDLDALLHYCQGVASTVGVAMCQICGVTDKRAIPHAVDLGIGMQITNIVRDVYEDAAKGQIYCPRDLFPSGFLTSDHRRNCRTVRDHYKGSEVLAVKKDLVDLADQFYRSGERGYCFLPLRARLAVASAAKMYRKIGMKSLAQPEKKRAAVSFSEKAALGCAALKCVFATPSGGAVREEEFYREMAGRYARV